MKKIFLFLVVFIFASIPAWAASFPDVVEDHYNYEAVEYLAGKKVVNGYPNGTFGPENLVNRAEAMKMITLAIKISVSGEFEILFPDVKKEDWFFSYVMAAKKSGIIKGYADGKFKPQNPVTLAEALKMLIESVDVELPKVTKDIFVDVKEDDWFAPYMLYAKTNNLIFADARGGVQPNQSLNRAAFAEIVYRMMIVIENENKPFPIEQNWDEYLGETIPFKIKYDSEKWEIIETPSAVSFVRYDNDFLQFSPFRIYPNSAVVTVTLDLNENGTAKEQYFTNIKAAFKNAEYTNFDLGSLKALEVYYPDKRTTDWYIYLANETVLVVYTQHGDGALALQHQQFIKAMLGTFDYNAITKQSSPDYSELLDKIFKNILIEDKGMETLDLLPDKKIIETDTIGVGTGPVDYYYSISVDYTFKYEREGDVILDKRKGNTTAF